ncbi:RNA exonuclease 1 homolog isoform X2 [Muntiacus reevesi]|uniref:RNA exonuclease 1 homolog isoform X2 n=1 Tax=Muntiacus reevesi TaxID=9886 RepID=UPI003306B4C2
MLRSTGFFRAIDCPYWAGAPGGPCRRPYCHFRHRGARGPGAPGEGGAVSPAAGLGYDPYNPELPKPPAQRENGTLGRGIDSHSDILELELVNQAIEAVRSEVELEQRRYQELLETARECGSAEAPVLAPHGPAACPATSLDGDTFPLSFDYNPSSHGLLSPDASYQPTPLAATAEPGCKYSLASPDRAQGHGGGGGGALEYVPKAVGQPRRYGRPVSSSKYVVDNSKPSTDLEYDPLSNFSARLLSRASTKDERAPKRPRCSRGSEPYTPAPKKPCDPFGSCDARFSDSDDDAAVAPGDKPVTTSPPRAQRGTESKAPGKPGSREGPELEEGGLRETKEMAVQCDVEDLGPPPRSPGRPPLAKPSSPARAAPERSSLKEGRPKKKSGVPPTANHKDSVRKTDKGAGSDVDYSALEKEVDFDSDPMEECLRIFNESTAIKTEDKGRLARQPPKEEKTADKGHSGLTTLFPGQKRRISHLSKQGKEAEPTRRGPAPPARPPTAQEVCYRRAQQAQRESAGWLQAAQQLAEKPSSVHISAPGEKRRIAHVPNPLLAAAPTGAKRTLSASSSQPPSGPEPGSQPLKTRTLSGMASKTTTTVAPKRVAHSPSLQSLKKPIIPKEFGGKVPTVIRQRYLNLFIEECLKFCSSNQEAIEKALNEEKVAYDRSPSKNIYLNVAVNTLKKLRGLGPGAGAGLNKTSGRKVVSHEVVLGGKLAARTSFSLSRPSSPRVEDLKGAALYSRLKEYLLTEGQLKENGYPFPHPEKPGGAIIFTAEEKKPKDSSCRICCRCGAEYLVSSSGRCMREEECYYHWGRLRRNRVAGGWETQYTCCSAAIGSTGCQVAKQHVQDGRKENLEGFVKTFEKELSGDAHPGVYALDCEMSYTTYGLELTRVTVVDTDLQVVYDTFVRPDNEIVDYNTRFSGVTEADLADTSISLRDVQAVLLSMFSSDTVLIGHSLESDLLALKVIHSTVVDTSVLFPHRLGLPYKRSLRNLMADYLRQIIQDNVDGHSSSEDASACMHLVIWKIREDAKTKR